MKEQEEREQNEEGTFNAQEFTVKASEQASEQVNDAAAAEIPGATAEEQEDVPLSSVAGGVQEKESQPCDTAQGALGQVKAKVEICKDESIGKIMASRCHENVIIVLFDVFHDVI